MPKNFIPCDRDQEMLLPPNMMEWLPEDHLALYVIDAVEQLDLTEFYSDRREDGHGRAAFEPKMMVTLLLYCYAIGVRSAREIERRLTDDVACRVITADNRIDHSTICRFRARYREALSELFVAVLGLCEDAGMLRPAVVAIDGSKFAANASQSRNLTKAQLEELTEEIFSDAERIDQQEDELYGERRGDEIPEHLLDRSTRIEFLKRRLAERQAAEDEARKPSKRRPARINTTDPDSAVQRASGGYFQGYNGQLAVTLDQIIVAADLTAANNDVRQLEPMVTQAQDNLEAIGADGSIDTVVADAGYFSEDNAALELGAELLIAPVASRTFEHAIGGQPELPSV